jgi:hypothetical protein
MGTWLKKVHKKSYEMLTCLKYIFNFQQEYQACCRDLDGWSQEILLLHETFC